MPWRDLLPKMIEEYEKSCDTLPASPASSASTSEAPNVKKFASWASFGEAKLTEREREALAALSNSTARPASMSSGIVCDDIDLREMFGRGAPLNEKLVKSDNVVSARGGARIAE